MAFGIRRASSPQSTFLFQEAMDLEESKDGQYYRPVGLIRIFFLINSCPYQGYITASTASDQTGDPNPAARIPS